MRIVSGMRPTGKLHVGHFLGVLRQWLALCQQGHECFFFVADWHALTTDYQKASDIQSNTYEMVLDWLSVGIDPARSTLFLQSHILQHAELYLLLGMITPVGWLERNPTYKELRQEATQQDLSNFGFLGYPVLQAADILLYKGEAVPVGQDQVPHLELTREIARRFNNVYDSIFPQPQALLTSSPKINGVDGRKMSKSYNNAILLCDDEAQIQKKIQIMVTDPKRARRNDPGDPDTCNLYPLHEAFSPPQTIAQVRQGCTTAGIGCVDCKQLLLPFLLRPLEQIRHRREQLAKSPNQVHEILNQGAKRVQPIATATMKEVKKTLGLTDH